MACAWSDVMRVGSDRSVNGVSSRGSDLDLRLLGLALWQKKWKVLVPTFAVAVLTVAVVNIITPRYESEARLLVEGRENVFLRPGNERVSTDDTRAAIDAEAITSQAQVLQSRDIALKVIKELKLGERPEFDPVRAGPSLTGTILSLLGLGKDTLRLTPDERVMTNYYERLSVIPIEKSRVIQIKFQSSDPELSARAVNAIVDTYFVFQRASKIEQNRNASRWLEQEIEKLRPKVAEAERNVENFRAKANLFVGTNNAGLTNQQLADVTTQLAAARSQKADLDARARMIRNMLRSGRPIESSDITNSELIRRLVEQRVTLRAQLAEQSSTLMDQHPRIKELRAQIVALDVQIRVETGVLVESIENDARIAAARIETTMAAADQLKNQIAGLSTQDVQLRALEREAKAQRDLLESYLGKYREATTRDSLESAPSDVRVISRAIASNTPAFPKKMSMV
ncbi:MAG: GumC family protein, partial [Pseudorhodoplanes sp.]